MKNIKISKALRDYIERLHYEVFRYEDLFNTIDKNNMSITDEEWESSYSYFQTLYEEAKIELQLAKKEIANIYKNDIGEDVWHINFADCELRIGAKTSSSKNIDSYSRFNNKIARLYPNPDKSNTKYRVKTITFQVTDACNLACTYCYQHNKGKHSMSFETAKEVIDMLLAADYRTNSYIDLQNCQGLVIEFIGGEPLIKIELMEQITTYFIQELFRLKHPLIIRFMISTISNGLLHFDSQVQQYIKKHNNHFSYSISIDGNKEIHDTCRIDLNGQGSYDRAITAVQDYRKNYKSSVLRTKMTISPDNVNLLFNALVDMIENQHYTLIHLNCVFEEGWELIHAQTLYRELIKITDYLIENNLINDIFLSIFQERLGQKLEPENNNNWCGGTGSMLSVDYLGNFYPCQRYSPTSIGNKQEPYIIGTLTDGINIENEHKKRIECLNCITRRSQSTNECFNCPIASGCAWCSAYNYEVFGTPDKRATYICIMHKARVLANMYYQWKTGNKAYQVDFPTEWAMEIIGKEEYDKLLSLKK